MNLKLIGGKNQKLKTKCKFTEYKRALRIGRRMVLFMKRHNCWAVAANQFGIMERVAAVKIDGKIMHIIDPKITMREGKQRSAERSLSWPTVIGNVNRPHKLTFEHLVDDGDGGQYGVQSTVEGFNATIIEHVVDQLDGIRVIDKMDKKMPINSENNAKIGKPEKVTP